MLIALVMAMAPAGSRAQVEKSKFGPKIDSLIQVAENAPDSLAARFNNDVCWKLRNISPEVAIQYGMKALEKAESTQDSLQLVKAYAYLGVCQRNLDNFDEALKYYNIGISKATEYGIEEQLGYGYVNLGNLLIYQKKFDKAEEELLKALPIAEKISDSSILGYIYLNLGRTRLGMKDFDASEEYFMKAIDIRTKCKKLNKQVSVPRKYLADCHATAGLTQLALKEYIATLESVDPFADYDLLGELSYNIAKINFDNKKYDEAFKYAKQSLTYARSIGSQKSITDSYAIIASVLKIKKDAKGLSDCYIQQIECYDSLIKKQVEQQSYNIRYSADTYYRQTKIASLNEEKRWRWHINVMSLIILVLMGAAVAVIILNIRKVKRLNKMVEGRNARLEAANYEITSSINYARRIQKSALSTQESIANSFPDSMVYYKPREIVSGDWYRLEAAKGKIIIAEGDCASDGVPGSLLTMMGMSIFKDTVNATTNGDSPMKASSMLEKMRQQVKKMFQDSNDNHTGFDGGMDASIAVIDPQTREMSFAAACQTALIIRGGDVIRLKGDTMRVGNSIKEEAFTEQEVQLQKDDTLYIMNNGIRDLKNPDGERFISGRLEKLLVENNTKPLAEVRTLLHDEINAWTQSPPPEDMTMIGIRIE